MWIGAKISKTGWLNRITNREDDRTASKSSAATLYDDHCQLLRDPEYRENYYRMARSTSSYCVLEKVEKRRGTRATASPVFGSQADKGDSTVPCI